MTYRSLITAVLLSAMAAGAQAAELAGTWSNIRVNDATGEARGMELSIGNGPAPSVSITDCERQCRPPVTVPGIIDGNRLSFSADLGRGAVSSFTATLRDDDTLSLSMAGRPWNAQILRRE